MSNYDSLLGRREAEDCTAETFAAEFPAVTGRAVKLIDRGESPDYIALVEDVETGLELTAIHAGDAESIASEILQLAEKKHASYERRGLFARPMMLLGSLDWSAKDGEGKALFDVAQEIGRCADFAAFRKLGFSEVWLMDDGPKYTSRRDPRAPADFYCFSPLGQVGFYQWERKRRPYWSLVQDCYL